MAHSWLSHASLTKFDYKCKADYNKSSGKSKATGKEKLFRGIVDPVVCKCLGTPNEAKAGLTKTWKLGPNLKIHSRYYVANSLAHTQELSTKSVSVLWRPGDWLMGMFLMSVLPQSSYLQGKGECLHCGIETAALTRCAEVIACGGGSVSREALEAVRNAKPAVSTALSVQSETPKQLNVTYREPLKDTATAIYDYQGQAQHDLTFKQGDIIEIIIRGKEENQWWIGKLNGKQGAFPAKYVKVNSLLPPPPTQLTITAAPSRKALPSTIALPFTPPASPGPSSPPPAYATLSPSATPASNSMDFFAVSNESPEKTVPTRPIIRRKPVPVLTVSPTQKHESASTDLLWP